MTPTAMTPTAITTTAITTTVTTRPAKAPSTAKAPSLRVERALLREGHRWLAAMDEVGRGALAGPATVGVVLVDLSVRTAPSGVRDSKLLLPAARQALAPRIRRWAPASAVGHAAAGEVDSVGILGALRRAARRALAALPVSPDLVLLDGNHDWLTEPEGAWGPALPGLSDPSSLADPSGLADPSNGAAPPVRTMIKADLRCSSVAAASVLAKVERDALMEQLHQQYPEYGWAGNKGYAAPDHLDALGRLGPCAQHRRSWRLPGCGVSQVAARVQATAAGFALFDPGGGPPGGINVGAREVS
ncbi:MAG: ribonuclease HII [Angustibacter sp.]